MRSIGHSAVWGLFAAAGIGAGLATAQVPAFTSEFVLEEGQAIPGVTGLVDSILEVAVNDRGEWMGRGTLSGAGAFNGVLVRNGAALLVEGAAVANSQGVTLTQNAGQFASVQLAQNNLGDWAYSTPTDESNAGVEPDWVLVINGNLALKAGDPVDAPQLNADAVLSSSPPNVVRLNDSDTVALVVGIANLPGGSTGRAVLTYTFDPATGALSNPNAAAFVGGTAGAFTLSDASPAARSMDLNAEGDVLFIGTLAGQTSATDVAILGYDSATGVVTPVAREGDQAPGYPNGVLYTNLGSRAVALGDGGDYAYTSVVTGPFSDNFGLFKNGSLLVRRGVSTGLDGTIDVLNTNPVELDADGNTVYFAGSTGDPTRDAAWLYNGEPLARENVTVVEGLTLTRPFAISANAMLSDDGSRFIFVGAYRATPGVDPELNNVTILTLSVGCAADFDGSGVVEVADIFAFLSAWFASGPGSDFDGSGATEVADIFAFLSAWFAGCN